MFPRNFPIDGEVANLLRTCYRHGQQVCNKLATSCNVIWETTQQTFACTSLLQTCRLCCGLQVKSSQVAFNKSNDNRTACTYKLNKKVIIKNTMSGEIQKKKVNIQCVVDIHNSRLGPQVWPCSAKNTSVDKGIFKKGSMNMGEGIVVCFGS